MFFVIIFQERKMKVKEKEKENKPFDLLLAISKENGKGVKLLGKPTDVTRERLFKFFSSSAWLYIFWIYIGSNQEKRERERKWESLHFLTLYKIQPFLLTGVF